MANLSIVKNPQGLYVINLTTEVKTNYPVGVTVKIDGTAVVNGVTASSLPFTTPLSIGVHEIVVTAYSINGSYNENACIMNDTQLYCAILDRLSKLPEKERYVDNTLYIHYILSKGLDNTTCICSCPTLKVLYNDIKNYIDPNICC